MIVGNIDRAWFNANPWRNFRIRRPTVGEVESIIVTSSPSSRADLVLGGNKWNPPDGFAWRIAVINIGPGVIARLICMHPESEPDDLGEHGETGTALPMIIGGNMVLDNVSA